jgi:hypothetical protein
VDQDYAGSHRALCRLTKAASPMLLVKVEVHTGVGVSDLNIHIQVHQVPCRKGMTDKQESVSRSRHDMEKNSHRVTRGRPGTHTRRIWHA